MPNHDEENCLAISVSTFPCLHWIQLPVGNESASGLGPVSDIVRSTLRWLYHTILRLWHSILTRSQVSSRATVRDHTKDKEKSHSDRFLPFTQLHVFLWHWSKQKCNNNSRRFFYCKIAVRCKKFRDFFLWYITVNFEKKRFIQILHVLKILFVFYLKTVSVI